MMSTQITCDLFVIIQKKIIRKNYETCSSWKYGINQHMMKQNSKSSSWYNFWCNFSQFILGIFFGKKNSKIFLVLFCEVGFFDLFLILFLEKIQINKF